MTTPIYNTASRLCLLLAFAAMALTSCDNSTDTELSNITFGANNTDSVALNKQSTRIVLLHGGTGKYQANIADSKVAKHFDFERHAAHQWPTGRRHLRHHPFGRL